MSIAIVDTPGFDDTTRSDAEILDEITQFLVAQYQLGIPLRGLIYLHRITDMRMQGSALRYFQMFQKICGEEAFGNVVLVTTMWDQLRDPSIGLKRDQELRKEFWCMMEKGGSQIYNFDGSSAMAQGIVIGLAGKKDIVLRIQREVNDYGKTLEDTSAGRLVAPSIYGRIMEAEDEIATLDRYIAEAERNQDVVVRGKREREKSEAESKLARESQKQNRFKAAIGRETKDNIDNARKSSKKTDGLQLFAAVLGLSVSLVFNILPLFGVSI
ncbi:hypothetical protein M501DRAFT_999295 [Patellaria atrata CBS 101060]|uniref:AIG1-type G domain-containing protein n=1 Tax=Patellaria atrata CBS 101060 TaxID=1346257 RepID=A0A9P4S2S8_9PEZI|nr:hypothetical protein M501DRAFT_999295 [Patellaria atrata CBS 101060]